MVKRAKLGITFNYDETWIGGVYYIKNLISALGLLRDEERPEIYLLSNGQESFDFIQRHTSYPYLKWVRPAKVAGVDGGIFRRLKLRSALLPSFLKKELKLDMVFPFPISADWKQTVCWIPDFQDKHLPDLFSEEDLRVRTEQHRYYFENFDNIVFSSEAARSDFERFYPEARVNKHVVHFAVVHELRTHKAAAQVEEELRLPQRFFYCPNQFWIHKNHRVVIEAVSILKQEGVSITVAFSGKEHDHRAPDHTDSLKRLVAELGLQENIRFLGFLPREDQIVLFENAVCIIQPSLFEGWSTVIEDAKSYSQYVIASDLPTNREQIQSNVEFFDPHDARQLASCLKRYAEVDPSKQAVDYRNCQLAFGHDFIRILRQVTQNA
jgi:glycosyltransferase involved in cell wall biosynthesis